MQSQRWAWTHRHAVPMFVASVVAVILSGAALTVVVIADRSSGSATGPTGTDPSADPDGGLGQGPAAGHGPVGADAECLVGSWQVVSLTQGTAGGLGSLLDGQVVLVSEGPVFEFQADGSGRADYGEPTIFEAQTLGDTLEMEVRGQIDFGYEAADGRFRLIDPTTNAQATMPLVGQIPFQLDTETVSFTCDEQAAEFSSDDQRYQARYERIR